MNPEAKPSRCAALVLAGVAMIAVVPQATAQEKNAADAVAARHDLRPRFAAGRTSRFEFWEKRTMSTQMTGPHGEHASNMSMSMKGHMVWKVDHVADDGSATCTLTMPWARTTIEMADQEPATVDSREDVADEGPMGQWLRTMVTTPLVFEMNADGSVMRFMTMDALRDAMGEMGERMKEETFIEMASTLATIPGAGAEHERESDWQRRNDWSRDYGGMPTRMDQTKVYRLDSVECVAGIPIATLSATATFEVEPDLDKAPPGMPPLDVKILESRSNSQIVFDLKRHEVIGRNSVETVRLEVSMQLQQASITTIVDEKTHGQVIRIAEDEGQDDEG